MRIVQGKRVQGAAVALAAAVLCQSVPVAAQSVWQTHSLWCTTDGGQGGQIYRNSCTQYDQFDSILMCQQHNPGAVDAVQRAGRQQVDAFMAQYAPAECRQVYGGPPPGQNYDPEVWKTHATWCTSDNGDGGRIYRNACTRYDQFDSILMCQQHNPGAVDAVQRAGRRQVDAFMAQYAPQECQTAYPAPPGRPPGPPPYGADPVWKTHATWCASDNGEGGQTYRNSCTRYDQFDSIMMCQQHNPGAQEAVQRAGRQQVNAFMTQYAPPQCMLAGGRPPGPGYEADSVWRTHATWCTTDGGDSGQIYRNACARYDQFDSILMCQQHNPGAVEAVQRAGRQQVDAFMRQYQPPQCR